MSDVAEQLTPPPQESPPQVEALRVQITELQDQVTRQRVRADLAEGHMQTIADALLEEAQARDWCDEYDRFCERVNRVIGRPVLTPYDRRWNITYSVTLTVSGTTPDAVRANAESALRCVNDDEYVEDVEYRYEEMERV